MSTLTLYLLVAIDDVKNIFSTLGFILITYGSIALTMYIIWLFMRQPYIQDAITWSRLDQEEKAKEKAEKNAQHIDSIFGKLKIRFALFCGILLAVTAVLIPTRNELIFIYLTNKITTNEQIMDIPEKVLELANLKLDELISKEENDN